jgi:uncharacterized phage protein gp47/JayE
MNFNINQDEVRGIILKEIKDNDKLKKLTNLNEGSRWMLVINACVWAIVYFIQRVMSAIYDAMFLESADRYALIRYMRDEGLSIKGEDYATGYVRIGSSSLPTERKDIAQGSFVKTESGYSYETLSGGYIDNTTPVDTRGKYTILLPIKATLRGGKYNVQADAVNTFESSIDGIDAVYNPEAISGGQDEEETEDIRSRLKDAKKDPGRGTMTWFKSEAEKFTGVERVIVIPRYSGRGTVGLLIIGTGGLVEDALIQSMSDFFNNDDIDPAGAYYVSPFRPQYFYQDYSVTVWYDPAKGEPSDSSLNSAMSDYLKTLSPGGTQVLTVAESNILQSGLKDVKITSPVQNVTVPDFKISALGNITWTKEVWNG